MIWIKKLSVLAIVVMGVISVSGCNTMDGAGRDVESAGESVQDAAN